MPPAIGAAYAVITTGINLEPKLNTINGWLPVEVTIPALNWDAVIVMDTTRGIVVRRITQLLTPLFRSHLLYRML